MNENERLAIEVEGLDTPFLLVDLDRLERNIACMQRLAGDAGIAYRPHTKTHKSAVIAGMQLDAGAVGICCAKLGEAEVMAELGIDDILITTEVVGKPKIVRMTQTAHRAKLTLVADNEAVVTDLSECAQTAGVKLGVLVDADVGQGRTGVASAEEACDLAMHIADSNWLEFRGVQGYQGRIQMTVPMDERASATRAALDNLLEAAERIRAQGLEVPVLTGGGTGTSVIDTTLHGLTEIQPGSYVFMDSRYAAIEWRDAPAPPFENALFVYGTVISRPARDRAVLDVGMKAASGDGGAPVPLNVPDASFAFSGDEHGLLTFDGKTCPLEVGGKVALVPSHCDTTVNLYDQYVVARNGVAEGVWEVSARGRVQ